MGESKGAPPKTPISVAKIKTRAAAPKSAVLQEGKSSFMQFLRPFLNPPMRIRDVSVRIPRLGSRDVKPPPRSNSTIKYRRNSTAFGHPLLPFRFCSWVEIENSAPGDESPRAGAYFRIRGIDHSFEDSFFPRRRGDVACWLVFRPSTKARISKDLGQAIFCISDNSLAPVRSF